MRHALVTAGTKGLGRKVTERLLHDGYSVTVNYRSDRNAAERLKNDLPARLQSRIQLIQGDVTSKSDCLKLVQETVAAFGRIDLLIHNAGPYIFERKKLADYSDDEWNTMIDGNLSAAFYLTKHAIPHMRKQQFGRIITYGFQSAGAAPGWKYRSAFAAAKVGLVSFTKTVALEEAENGITVNMICPGNIRGEMKEATIAESRTKTDADTPVGRSGTGEDIARAIAFLCEDHSDLITGAILEVTGGVDVVHQFRRNETNE
ncbi:MAG TPA: SDR family oxidoreductase [Bacillales bacterium]|nr:SDR family oxidoreductase [Bacillales bacterium]